MIQKAMRADAAISLAAAFALFYRVGSSSRYPYANALVNFVTVVWIVSTAALLVLFILRIVEWSRRKSSGGIWFDLALAAVWVVVMAVIIVVGATAFAGF